jgi:hypothetical protein
MFAKSKQIGLVSLFVVFAAAIGGCAESVGTPASFPSEQRPVAFISRLPPAPTVTEDLQVTKVDTLASRTDAKHSSHAVTAAIH